MKNFKLTKNGCPPEYIEQVSLANFLRVRYPHLLWTASAGGMRTSIGTAKKMKAMGYAKGTPDIMIFEPTAKYKGLFIELKTRKGGSASPEQRYWVSELLKRGYYAVVCNGCEEAEKVISNYMEGKV